MSTQDLDSVFQDATDNGLEDVTMGEGDDFTPLADSRPGTAETDGGNYECDVFDFGSIFGSPPNSQQNTPRNSLEIGNSNLSYDVGGTGATSTKRGRNDEDEEDQKVAANPELNELKGFWRGGCCYGRSAVQSPAKKHKKEPSNSRSCFNVFG